MSTDEIAKAISEKYEIGVGRNAVIGFYHRVSTNSAKERGTNLLAKYPLLKPSGLTDAQRQARSEAAFAREKKKRDKREAAKPKLVVIENKDFDDLPDEGYGVDLMALKEGCRWPTSRSDRGATLFCNHRTHKHNYCEGHHKRSRYA